MTVRKVFVRNPYNYDVEAASDESGLRCLDESLAQQQFKEESDINTIVDRFQLNGELPANPVMPEYGDFDQVSDFQSAMNAVLKAQADFMQLPAKVRSRFDNDPQKLLEFVSDDKNLDEARVLGLVKPLEVVSEPPKAS